MKLVERCPRCEGPVSQHCSNPKCGWLRCSNSRLESGKMLMCGTAIDPTRGMWVVGVTGERGEV